MLNILRLALLLIFLIPTNSEAAPPAACNKGALYYDIISTTEVTMYVCTSQDTWISVSANAAIPTGAIIFVASGTCPANFTEVSALNGKMWRGTVAANANVGQTGGADSVTPTIASLSAAAQTISGSVAAEAAHTHTVAAQVVAWPAGVPTNGAISIGTFVNSATATTGNCAATNLAIGTGATTACKATAPNLTVPAQGHSGTLTSPTISWPPGVPTTTGNTSGAGSSHLHSVGTLANATSAVTGTLNAIDNKAAYINLIGCSKN